MEKKLLTLRVGESAIFNSEDYATLNALICQKLARQNKYYSMESIGDEVRITRINKNDRPKRRAELLAMQVGEQAIEHGDNYRTLYATISKLHRQSLGEWSILKDGDLVIIKRIE